KKTMDEKSYAQVHSLFQRTLITAKAYESAATAYFGYRIWAQGESFQSEWLRKTMSEALERMAETAIEIDNYSEKVPRGQWNWRGDAATLREYNELITKTGWEEYGNRVFK
ncbi:MAG TPA: hypothetical protein PKI12_02525, partial [Bacteroidales bacterium]|nr:hypothetical protein [Bacteroidales bacterium]